MLIGAPSEEAHDLSLRLHFGVPLVCLSKRRAEVDISVVIVVPAKSIEISHN